MPLGIAGERIDKGDYVVIGEGGLIYKTKWDLEDEMTLEEAVENRDKTGREFERALRTAPVNIVSSISNNLIRITEGEYFKIRAIAHS